MIVDIFVLYIVFGLLFLLIFNGIFDTYNEIDIFLSNADGWDQLFFMRGKKFEKNIKILFFFIMMLITFLLWPFFVLGIILKLFENLFK